MLLSCNYCLSLHGGDHFWYFEALSGGGAKCVSLNGSFSKNSHYSNISG